MTPFEVEERRSISALNRDVVDRVAGAVQELGRLWASRCCC